MDLASRLDALEPTVAPSDWSGYEHYRGYGVMSLPLSSGHVLGLRAIHESDLAPYVSVWHQDPDGGWAIYSDGPSLDTTCPRLWGPALRHAALADIDLTWTGPDELHVEMAEPHLDWTMTIAAPGRIRRLNRINAALPGWTWRVGPLLRSREWMARSLLDMGRIRFSFPIPRGDQATLVAKEVYGIPEATAVLDGTDLGHPVDLAETPMIGDVALPSRPTFAIGDAYAEIGDREEFERTREWVTARDR